MSYPSHSCERCDVCGRHADACQCAVCQVCGWQGRPACYKEGHLPYKAVEYFERPHVYSFNELDDLLCVRPLAEVEALLPDRLSATAWECVSSYWWVPFYGLRYGRTEYEVAHLTARQGVMLWKLNNDLTMKKKYVGWDAPVVLVRNTEN